MKFLNGATATLIAFAASVASIPMAAPSELVPLNTTSIEEAKALLAKRAAIEYFIMFYSESDCAGDIITLYSGISPGSIGCTALAQKAHSMYWTPGEGGGVVRVSTGEDCLGRSQSYGAGEEGCKQFQAQIHQSGVAAFRVD